MSMSPTDDGVRWRCLFISLLWLMAWVAVTLVALAVGLWVAGWVAGRM